MMNSKTVNETERSDWRWQIVERKAKDFDYVFYTGVASTGIYCKPSCPARTPKRENMTFYASAADAENAGFRACLRCKPQLQAAENPNAVIIAQACDLISRKIGEDVSLEDLSANLNVSAGHLHKIFKAALGISPKEFADARRLETFKQTVKQSDVTTAMYDSGYGSSRALYEKASANLGMTPAIYRKGGKGMKINFAVTDSPLGKMLIAATEKGVCAVKFGDADKLENDLRDEFPAAEVAADATDLQECAAAVIAQIEGRRETFELPLDVQATAFQLRVWAELRKIPRGETRTYKQIAVNIGNEKAVRAVARACATNPVAVVNPCHRVIGSDGKLTGYRWGVERKQDLLDLEQLK